MSISVVLPAYEEADNLRNILPVLHENLKKTNEIYEIIIVDTMEPKDDTVEVCRRNDAVYVPRKGGNLYGDAIRTGISVAQYDRIVIMDADGSHNPADIVKFNEVMTEKKCDIVIGSRYIKGGNSHNGFILQMMSKTLNISYRILFKLNVKDVSDSFRMYKSNMLKAIELTCDNFDVVEEILIRMQLENKKLSIIEVPIFFNKRVHGSSKRDLLKFIKSYIRTMARLYKIKAQYKAK